MNESKTVRNLVYFFYLTNGLPSGKRMYEVWGIHPVLKEYKRPSVEVMEAWCKAWAEEELTGDQR